MKTILDKVEELIENELLSEDFMKKIFGDDTEYEIDYDDKIDTDIDKNPYKKDILLLSIQRVSKEKIIELEKDINILTDNIKKWCKKYNLESFFDDVYINDEDKEVVISFNIPSRKDKWDYKKEDINSVENKKDDNVEFKSSKELIIHTINKLKIKENSTDLINYANNMAKNILSMNEDELHHAYNILSSIEHLVKNTKSKLIRPHYESIQKSKSGLDLSEKNIKNEKTSKLFNDVNSKLKEKYNVTCSDIMMNENELDKKFNYNNNVDDIINLISKQYELIPIEPEKNSKEKQKDSNKTKGGSYLCKILDLNNNIIGEYQMSYKDNEYAKIVLDTIGIKLKNTDKIIFE